MAALPVAHAAAALPVAAKRESRIIGSTFRRATISNRKLLPPKGCPQSAARYSRQPLATLPVNSQQEISRLHERGHALDVARTRFAGRTITWTPAHLPRQCRQAGRRTQEPAGAHHGQPRIPTRRTHSDRARRRCYPPDRSARGGRHYRRSRCAYSEAPAPLSWCQACRRPVVIRSRAATGPVIVDPAPADQSVSVATRR